MVSASDNNRRIAKNTVFLYIRMFVMMAVGLFTSRVILQTLGVEDYGIYSAVGGFVAMFGLLSGTLTNSINRFLAFELGRGDEDKLKRVFSTSLNVMMLLSLLVLLLSATVGVWFLNTHMVIPPGRESAANWVLAFSILAFIINLISVPYNAAVVAHERMSAFAYISIIDALFRLAIVYALYVIPFDKLVTYSLLFTLVGLLIRIIYGIYCKRHFPECTYRLLFDRPLMKQITSFAGWNFLVGSANLINNAGVNVMMNLFFGVTVNAARGIATQLNTYAYRFFSNFMMALNPQITKSYAQGDLTYMHSLVCRGAKFSYFLILFFLIPVCLEAHQILHLWLGIVPAFAVPFVQLTLIASAINVLSGTIITSVHATGNIRRFMIIVGAVEIINFPLTYLAFRLGASPLAAYYIYIAIYLILMFLRFILTKDLIHMPASMFIRGVYLKALVVTILALILPAALRILMPGETLLRFLLICLVSLATTTAAIFYAGLDPEERGIIIRVIKKKLSLFHS